MPIEERFHRFVVDELANDRLVLPTLPEVASRVRALTVREDVSSAMLAAEIGKDPAMAVRVLRVANSAAQRGSHRIDNLQQAVTRLGLEYTRLLVNTLAMEQLFDAPSAMLRDRLRRSWQRSISVAALSQAIASHFTLLDPERALLAGLVHEVGALPIIRLAQDRADLVEPGPMLDAVIRLLSPRIGRMVLQAWHFPPELAAVPALCTDLRREHEGPADYADVVCVARLQMDTLADAATIAARAQVPAYAKLDMSPDADPLNIEICRGRYEMARAAFAA